MSYSNGTAWERDDGASPEVTRTSRRRHAYEAIAEGALLSLLVVALVASTALAGKGNGRGGGSAGGTTATTAGCTVDGQVVTGTALPTDQVLNFFVTDSTGSKGWVLGWTDSGSWSEPVPARSGTTTYEFASKTWGPGGTKYTVFASCTAD